MSNETNDPSIASYLNVLSLLESWGQETKSSDYPLTIKFQEEKRGQFHASRCQAPNRENSAIKPCAQVYEWISLPKGFWLANSRRTLKCWICSELWEACHATSLVNGGRDMQANTIPGVWLVSTQESYSSKASLLYRIVSGLDKMKLSQWA